MISARTAVAGARAIRANAGPACGPLAVTFRYRSEPAFYLPRQHLRDARDRFRVAQAAAK